MPRHPKRDQVKDHRDDCNDNPNFGDDRVLKMTVIVMTTTMTTPVMTMVTTVGPDDDNNNGDDDNNNGGDDNNNVDDDDNNGDDDNNSDDDRSKNIPLHHQVPRTECRSVPRNVCNPVIFENSLNSQKSHLLGIESKVSNINISGLHPNLLL